MNSLKTILIWAVVILAAFVAMKFLFRVGLFILVGAGAVYLLMKFGKSKK